jgi:dTDP-4-amino-4,6-dideoxygalactose transaminase
MADMAPILKLARARGIAVVEDACQAHGAMYRGRRAGALGDIGCFSFYPTKNLGSAGEGGIAVTGSSGLAARMRALREHGQTSLYRHESFGFNYRLPAIQAAVLRVKLTQLDTWNEARQVRAAIYGELLAGLGLALPVTGSDRTHVYHLYVIRSRERDRLRECLQLSGVSTGIHYPLPVHLQPYYRHLSVGPGSLPETEAAVSEIVSLPMYPELTRKQQERVAAALREFVGLQGWKPPILATLRMSADKGLDQ